MLVGNQFCTTTFISFSNSSWNPRSTQQRHFHLPKTRDYFSYHILLQDLLTTTSEGHLRRQVLVCRCLNLPRIYSEPEFSTYVMSFWLSLSNCQLAYDYYHIGKERCPLNRCTFPIFLSGIVCVTDISLNSVVPSVGGFVCCPCAGSLFLYRVRVPKSDLMFSVRTTPQP